MERKLVYDSARTEAHVREALANAREETTVIDVSDWDDSQKRSFYFREIMPLSVKLSKNLGEKRQDRHAGFSDYEQGLYITEDDIVLGEEILSAQSQ